MKRRHRSVHFQVRSGKTGAPMPRQVQRRIDVETNSDLDLCSIEIVALNGDRVTSVYLNTYELGNLVQTLTDAYMEIRL